MPALRVEPAVEAVPGDVATDLDQAPPHRPLLDDLDVGLDPSEIGQIDVEGREVGEPAGLLQLRRLLQRRLQGADVGRDLLLLQVEHRLIDEPVALVVEVVDRQAGGNRRQQPRVEQRRGEHGALGLFALRQRRLGGEALDHRRRGKVILSDASGSIKPMVPEAGFEPARPKAEDFKSPASAVPPLRLPVGS